MLIHWVAIYLVDNLIQPLNNLGLVTTQPLSLFFHIFDHEQKPKNTQTHHSQASNEIPLDALQTHSMIDYNIWTVARVRSSIENECHGWFEDTSRLTGWQDILYCLNAGSHWKADTETLYTYSIEKTWKHIIVLMSSYFHRLFVGPVSLQPFISLYVFRGSQPPESKTHQNGSKPPPGTQRHQNKAMQT